MFVAREQQMASVIWHAAENDFRNLAYGRPPRFKNDVWGIDQVRIYVPCEDRMWLTSQIAIFKNRLPWTFEEREAHDHAMYGGNSTSLVGPLKRTMGEVDSHTDAEQQRPQDAYLLSLRDRVRGNKRAFDLRALDIPGGLQIPSCDKVKYASAFHTLEHESHIDLLLSRLELLSNKGRVADDKGDALRGYHILPIDLKRVAVKNMR